MKYKPSKLICQVLGDAKSGCPCLLQYLFETDAIAGIDKRVTTPTWGTTPNGNPYIAASEEVMDPTGANVHSKVEQSIDNNGNLNWRKQYDYWTGTATPVLPALTTILMSPVTAV